MDCKRVQSLLSEYLDGCLDRENQTLVGEHLKTCSLCHQELEALQKTVSLIRSLEKLEPPRDFLFGVRTRIEREREAQNFWKRLITPFWIKVPLGGIATVALFVLILYFTNLLPSSRAPLVTMDKIERKVDTVLKDEGKGVGILAERKLVKPKVEMAVANIPEGLSDLSRITESLGGRLISPTPSEMNKFVAEKIHEMEVTLEIPASNYPQFLAKLEEAKSIPSKEKAEAKRREPLPAPSRALAPQASLEEKQEFLTIRILLIAREK